MNFYFCEKCGKRITDVDIDKGLGRNKKLKGVYCTDCSVGVMTMDSLPMLTDADARKVLAEAEAQSAEPARTRVAARHRDEGTKSGRRDAETPAQNKAAVYGGLAVAAIAVVMFLVLGRGTPPIVAQPKPQPATVRNTPPQSAQPAVVPQPVVAKAAPPEAIRPEAAANPEAAPRMGMLEQPKDEPTPKERYEQLVREGKIQPDAPAPAPSPADAPAAPVTAAPADSIAAGNSATPEKPQSAPPATAQSAKPPQPPALVMPSEKLMGVTTPPLNDPAWKKPLKDKVLEGWTLEKGSGVKEGVEYVLTGGHPGGAQLSTEKSYQDYEMIVQLYADDHHPKHIRVRGSFFEFAPPEKKWHTFHVVAKGEKLEATLDGAPYRSSSHGNLCARPAAPHRFASKGTLRIRELYVRELP